MRVGRIATVASAVAAMTMALSSCGLIGGNGGGGEAESVVQKAEEQGTLTIGIKFDQPGLGLREPDGSYTGFDVDVARFIAQELGVPEDGIEFVETTSQNRETFIEQGQVDLVLASYSITEERQERVSFGGPYYVAQQDILVRDGDDEIQSVEDLEGRTLCSASGSRSAFNVTETLAIDAQLREAGSYSECLELLSGGGVDAVTTDDTILAGYAAQQPGEFQLVGDKFSEERYGVGMPKGDTATCEAVNAAIAAMYEEGEAETLLDSNFGPANYEYTTELPEAEPCA
ncbi:glutamate ABC transporter substrate-binding protein [Marinitenerispora sediminis]|uniref:Glutamate-binding protein n=1 Tax=Marinitenerispora sediminis TaxID=1931232 RepID=A0A368T079_9ACTN|nr:glutamate ABC transporter substrate-binding protein [Marinitenerispora sediminis]RCV48581.1 glutamate-binding protein [Marinitenerispora sediminis]RCV49086.1 glutamate-binding protein [Marinitenerispora sediminis]RCV52388.1 glutamate-binding protein [Marinitenerispora sediminis]